MKNFKQLILISSLLFSPAIFACRIDNIQFAISSIRSYLQAHPTAVDTVQGIHYQWIDWMEATPPEMNCTFVALTNLEVDGEMERIQLASRELWRLKR